MKFKKNQKQSPSKLNHFYEIEKIVDHRKSTAGKSQYRVRWVGYADEDDTWQPIENLQSAIDLVEKFYQQKILQSQTNQPQKPMIKNNVNIQSRCQPNKQAPKQNQKNLHIEKSKIIKKGRGRPRKYLIQVEKPEIQKEGKAVKIRQKSFYKVSKIVGKKYEQDKIYYKVRWEGAGDKEDTWQPTQNMKKLSKAIDEYEAKLKEESNKTTPQKTEKIQKQKDSKQSRGGKKEKQYFLVEKILNRKITDRGILYLVRWKGYSKSEDTWQPYRNLLGARTLVKKFNDKYKYKLNRPKVQTQKRAKSMEKWHDKSEESRFESAGKETGQAELLDFEIQANRVCNQFEDEDKYGELDMIPFHINEKELSEVFGP